MHARDEEHGHARDVAREQGPRTAPRTSPVEEGVLRVQRLVGNEAAAVLLTGLAVQRKCAPWHKGPARSFGASAAPLTQEQWVSSGESTFSALIWHGVEGVSGGETSMVPLGTTASTSSATHGSEHAEDVALRLINGSVTMFSQTAPNKLLLSITKSPCTSTSRNGLPATSNKAVGCTEALIALVQNGIPHPTNPGVTYTFKLNLICRGLYCPYIPGYTQRDVLDASQEACDALRAAGITVSGDERPASSAARFEVK